MTTCRNARGLLVALASNAAGCSYAAPSPGRLRDEGADHYQAVAIRREGGDIHVRQGVSSVAWGSMAALAVLVTVVLAIVLVRDKRTPTVKMDPWRLRAAAFFFVFGASAIWWGASRLLVEHHTRFSVAARTAHLETRSLWGRGETDVVLGESATLFLVRVPSRSGSNFVLRLRVDGAEHTIAQAVGWSSQQPAHEAVRDELAALVGVGVDREVRAVYFAW